MGWYREAGLEVELTAHGYGRGPTPRRDLRRLLVLGCAVPGVPDSDLVTWRVSDIGAPAYHSYLLGIQQWTVHSNPRWYTASWQRRPVASTLPRTTGR